MLCHSNYLCFLLFSLFVKSKLKNCKFSFFWGGII
uniref:Uncharacterized protein n=1 Tax=Rhizophora mucronata TaxID=61149 RepID=A0A2P2QM93_RHIMU